MNNSQQMLLALEEQDLTKAEHYFVKALENDPSDLLYELATYLEGRLQIHQENKTCSIERS